MKKLENSLKKTEELSQTDETTTLGPRQEPHSTSNIWYGAWNTSYC